MNASLIKWLSDTPHHFRDNIAYGALDLSDYSGLPATEFL